MAKVQLETKDEFANFTGPGQSSPGMVVMFGTTTMLGVGIVLVQERRMGTLHRLLTTLASKASILAGKFAGTFMLGLLQTAVLIVFGWLVFDVPWGRDPLALVVVVFAFSLAVVIRAEGVIVFPEVGNAQPRRSDPSNPRYAPACCRRRLAREASTTTHPCLLTAYEVVGANKQN